MKDIYVYEGTNVLINKLNIRDNSKLDEAEGIYVSIALRKIIENPIKIRTLSDIRKIHFLLFEKLYEWAGEDRKMNMYKSEPVLNGLSVSYSDYKSIDSDLKKLNIRFKNIKWNELHSKEKIESVVDIFSKLWRIHCFREGNTRTISIMMYLFMKQIGLKVDVAFIGEHAKYFRSALVLASIDQYSEYEHLTNMLMDSVYLKDIPSNKYKTIRDYEVDKYEYQKHEYKD